MLKFKGKVVSNAKAAFVAANRVSELTLNGYPINDIVKMLDEHRIIAIEHQKKKANILADLVFNLDTKSFESIEMLGKDVYGDYDLFVTEVWKVTFDDNDKLVWKLLKSDPPTRDPDMDEDDYMDEYSEDFISIDELSYFGGNDECLEVSAVHKKDNLVHITVKPKL